MVVITNAIENLIQDHKISFTEGFISPRLDKMKTVNKTERSKIIIFSGLPTKSRAGSLKKILLETEINGQNNRKIKERKSFS